MAARAPTLEDAHAAAVIVVDAGATKVLLFGSVARGEADEYSDIDLVAVFDDIDYSQRQAIARGLNKQIKAQVGVDNDVVVTDRPEWKARTQGEVPTCFEAGISLEAVPLVNAQPSRSVDWDKPMVLPIRRYQEAESRMKDIFGQWDEIARGTLGVSPTEAEAWLHNSNHSRYLLHRNARFKRLCGSSHLAIEACLKLLLALYCVEPPKNIRDHRTSELKKMLRKCSPEQADITERLRKTLSHNEISFWHIASNYYYVVGGRVFKTTKERTASLIHLAERMTVHVLHEYENVIGRHEHGEDFSAVRDISAKVSKKVGLNGEGLDPEGFPGDNDLATVVAANRNQDRVFRVLSAIRKFFDRPKSPHSGYRSGLRRCWANSIGGREDRS